MGADQNSSAKPSICAVWVLLFRKPVNLSVLFITPPETATDIRALCARFSEGIGVEYKSTLGRSRTSRPRPLMKSGVSSASRFQEIRVKDCRVISLNLLTGELAVPKEPSGR